MSAAARAIRAYDPSLSSLSKTEDGKKLEIINSRRIKNAAQLWK